MKGIVDLASERLKRETDPQYRSQDQDGVPLFRFICQYRLGTNIRDFDIWAYSEEDAEARLNAIRETGWVEGRLICSS